MSKDMVASAGMSIKTAYGDNKLVYARNTELQGIKIAYYEALQAKQDKKLAWWSAFKQYFKGRIDVNSWNDEWEIDGLPAKPDNALTEFEGFLKAACPVDQATLKRWMATDLPATYYDPVKRYLTGLSCEPYSDEEWYGLCTRFLGLEDELSSAMLTTWLVAAVRRALNPGTYQKRALVIRGDQEAGKTPFLRILASEDLFYRMSSSAKDDDIARALRNAWVVEMGELESITRKKDVESLKAFLDECSDKIVEKYRTDLSTYKRHCVFAGTANSTDIFNDPTGSKRFMLLDMPSGHVIDLKELKLERDRIWKSAYERHLAGAPHRLDTEQSKGSEERNLGYSGDSHEKVKILDIANHLLQDKEGYDGIAVMSDDVAVQVLGYHPPISARLYSKMRHLMETNGFEQRYLSRRRRYVTVGAKNPLIVTAIDLTRAVQNIA